MSAPTRRGLLIALPVAALVPALPAVAAANPDAALIRACDAYRGLMDAVNTGDCGDSDDGHPTWTAYNTCCDTISGTSPQTMPGVLAKCRAIRAETRNPRGEQIALHGTMGEDWASDVVDALLALNGGAA